MLLLSSLTFFFCLFLSAPLQGLPPRGLDLSFGKNGIVRNDFNLRDPRIEVIAPDAGGNIIITGTARSGKIRKVFVAKLSSQGALDRRFGTGGIAWANFGGNESVHGLGIRPDGEIIVAGYFSSETRNDPALAGFNPDGSLNKNFGDAGVVRRNLGGRGELHYLVLGPDKKINVVGFLARGRNTDFLAGRLNADGSEDRGFGDRGWTVTDFGEAEFLYGATLQPDGKLVAVGSTRAAKEPEDCAALRYRIDGRLDAGFGLNGVSVLPSGARQDVCSSVALGDGSTLLLAGYSTQPRQDTDFLLFKLFESGKPDSNFGQNGRLLTDFNGGIDVAHAITFEKGRIFAGGEFEGSGRRAGGREYGFALASLSGNMKGPMEKFKVPLAPYSATSATTLALQADRKILLAGYNGNSLIVVRFMPQP